MTDVSLLSDTPSGDEVTIYPRINKMTSFLGNLCVFDYKIHEWEVFFGKLTQFIKLNSIGDDKQSAVLLTHLSDDSYRLLRNLVHPKILEGATYKELVILLNKHFTPKRSTFADRAKFYEAIKSDSESFEEWAARLRGLAVYCDFGTELDTLLRDRFVLGLMTGHERDKLFECDSKTLTLAHALEVAQKASCARQARAASAGAEASTVVVVKEEPVFYARAGARGTGGVGVGGSGSAAAAQAGPQASARKADQGGNQCARCTVCGMKNHAAVTCRFKNYKCQKCRQKGHLKKVCSTKCNLHKISVEGTEFPAESDCNVVQNESDSVVITTGSPVKLDRPPPSPPCTLPPTALPRSPLPLAPSPAVEPSIILEPSSPPSITTAEEVIEGSVATVQNNSPVSDRDAERDEWAEACEVMMDEPRPAELQVNPSVEGSSGGPSPARRSKRPKKPVNYKL